MKFQKNDVIKTRIGQHEFYVEDTANDKGQIPGLYAKIIKGSTGECWIHEADVIGVRSK